MEFLVSMVEIGKKLWEATGFGYLKSLDKNIQNLKRKIEDLSSQENDINTELSSAEYPPGKRRKKEVEVWLRDVQQIKGDVQRLRQEVVGERKNVFSRIRVGKHIVEKIEEVAKLQDKGRVFNGLVLDALPVSGQFIPTTKKFGKSTSARTKKKVWKCLMNDEVRKIAVFGMGGVGKTTIMHHINNRLMKETCDFDDVIWATVSKAFNVRKLQREIAKALNLVLSNCDDETKRASKLHSMLSQKEKYVLILDDLWEAFPLDKLGIPEPTRSNGCKLVITTRSFKVCRKMECKTVKVELLTEQEALRLFMSKAIERETVLAEDVKEIGKKVAKECARLPLALITVAGSMRGVTDMREWRNALNELISLTKEVRDDESYVFERLKFSYSRLKDEKLQHCFLYCALYPEDHNIPMEELIEYWIAEGLISEMNGIEAIFDKGHSILNKLIDTCLLEISTNYNGEQCVRMHDLIRDMALRITACSPRFMVKAGEGLRKIAYEDWSKDLMRVSLMYNRIGELPIRPPNCPRLTTLLLGHNDHALRVIPDSFFMHMPHLKVLDLSHNLLQYLPESISNLENLHSLLLENCQRLNSVPSLEKLKALKELKLNSSLIRDVPQGIEELVNLRKLDLSLNRHLETFPSWKLRRLTKLQFLRIDDTQLTVAAEELLCLRQLRVLSARFHNIQEFTRYVTSQQCQGLENYRLIVGNTFIVNKTIGKEASIDNDFELSGSGEDQLVLPSNIDFFEIQGCHTLISLSDPLRYARDLRTCHVFDCNGIGSILSSPFFSEDSRIPLITVESLILHDLPSFRVLFDGIVPPHNICFKLRKLFFSGCLSMTSIFPDQLLQNFPNLEELEVVSCDHVEDIIVEVEMSDRGHHQDCNTITLPNLRTLRLEGLPRLKSIYTAMMACESLHYIRVYKCPMVRGLPLLLHRDGEQGTGSPHLKRIEGDIEWWHSLEQNSRTTLQPWFKPF